MATARRSTRLQDHPRKSLKESDLAQLQQESDEDDIDGPKAAKRKASLLQDAQNVDPNSDARKKRPRQEKLEKLPADLHNLTLFEVIAQHGAALGQAVKEWVEHYTVDRSEAAAELLTVLVRAAGCDDDLTTEDVDSGDMDRLVTRLTELVIEEGGADPFRCRTFRNFSAGFCALWDKALRGLYAADLLFDEYLLEKLTSLVTALNTSVVRSFRYAATLAASQLISTWIGISASITEARERAGQQLAAEEKKKGAGKVAADRISKLRRTQDQCHRRVTDLRNFTSTLFQGVFAHRFRDVSEEIRQVVISGIGNWVAEDPDAFLSDQYLKYLAWALSDRHEAVRLAAVRAIHKLYANPDNKPRLQDFTDRFITRFQELMYDISIDVAVAGLALLQQLVKQGVLQPKAVSDVYKLLAEDSAPLRNAAAALAVLLLEEQGAALLQGHLTPGKAGSSRAAKKARSKGSSQGKDTHSPEQLQLVGLLAVMGMLALQEQEDLPSAERRAGLLSQSEGAAPLPYTLVAQLVEALAPHTPVLSDIPLLVGALAEEGAAEEQGKMSMAHLSALLAAALHRGATLAHHPAAGGRGRPRGAAGGAGPHGAFTAEMHHEATALLMEQLLPLLRLHQGDHHVEASLLALIKDLQLDLYVLKKADAAFKSMLQQASNVLGQTTDARVMAEAAASLVFCAKAGPAELQDTAQQVLRNCITTAAAKLHAAAAAARKLKAAALEEGVTDLDGSEPDDAPDALLSLHSCLRRCQVLLSAGAKGLAADKQLRTSCMALLQEHLQGRDLGSRLLSQLLQVTNLMLLWQQHAALASGGAAAELSAYTEARGVVVHVLDVLLDPSVPVEAPSAAVEPPSTKVDLQELAFNLLTNLVVVAGSPRWEGTALDGVRLLLSQDMTEKCWGYCRRLLELEVDPLDDDWDADSPDGGPSEEERTAAVEAAEQQLSARQVAAVVALGRLVAFRCLLPGQLQWLATQLVTLLVSGHPQVADTVREVCKALKRTHPDALPPIYTQALVTAFEAVEEAADETEALQLFAALAQKIAGMYAGFNLSVQAITDIVKGGLSYALEDAPTRLRFLPWGLNHFTNKLSPAAAEQLLGELEAAGEGHEEEENWMALVHYVAGLKERAAGQRVTKGVLKAPGARSKPRGKLSFAPTAAAKQTGSEQQEDEEGAGAGGWRGRGPRKPAPAAKGGGRKAAPMRQRAAKDSDSEEEDEESEDEQEEVEEQQAAATPSRGRGRPSKAAAVAAGGSRSPAAAKAAAKAAATAGGRSPAAAKAAGRGGSRQRAAAKQQEHKRAHEEEEEHEEENQQQDPDLLMEEELEEPSPTAKRGQGRQQGARDSIQSQGGAAASGGGSGKGAAASPGGRTRRGAGAGAAAAAGRRVTPEKARQLAQLDAGTLDTSQATSGQPQRSQRNLAASAGSPGPGSGRRRGAWGRSSLGVGRSSGRVSGGSSLNFAMPSEEEEEEEEEGQRPNGQLPASLGTTQKLQDDSHDLAAGDSSEEEEEGGNPEAADVEQLPVPRKRGRGSQKQQKQQRRQRQQHPDLAASEDAEGSDGYGSEEEAHQPGRHRSQQQQQQQQLGYDAGVDDDLDLDLTLNDSQLPSMQVEVDDDIEAEDEGEVQLPRRPARRRRRLH